VVVSTQRVDPSQYEAASKVFGSDLASRVGSAASTLERALAGAARMAGSDPAGVAWAAQYDPAAQNLVQALDDLRRASINVGGLLEQSGLNHGRAEAHSDSSRATPVPADTTRYVPDAGMCIAVPSASGGSDDAPYGWTMIQQACGAMWPDGDTGKLHAAATAWRAAGQALDACTQVVDDGVATIRTQVSPEVGAAVTVCGSLGRETAAIANQCRSLAAACDDLATHIDDAHTKLLEELAQFVALTAVIEVAGAIVGAVTFGGGEVVAQVGEGAEVANVIARVVEIVEALGAAVRAVVSRISVAALEGTGDVLKIILDKVPAVAETEEVADGAATLDAAADDLADSGLAGRHPDYPDRWPNGKYAGRDALSVDKEQIGLDQYAEDHGVEVINTKVRALVEGGRETGRYYDGLVRIGETDDYIAVEVKSGSAIDKYVGSDQEAFDKLVTSDNPATATLNGRPINIVRVERQDVP
jgi:hypothetical protein